MLGRYEVVMLEASGWVMMMMVYIVQGATLGDGEKYKVILVSSTSIIYM
jgi:hypothetical protein